jgi:spore coat polysaccharide biosynthesis protein SpsF
MDIEVLLITQARMGSTRLPGKIFKKIGNKTLLQIHLERICKANLVDKILVATTKNTDDIQVYDWAIKNNFLAFRGSEEDVLDRFYQAAKIYSPKWVVRVTSDCPLIDSRLIDRIIKTASEKQVDYCSNVIVENFPDGQDVEVFSFNALEKAWKLAELKSDREHVTSFIRNNIFGKGHSMFSYCSIESDKNYSKIRLTVDEEKDYIMISKLIEAVGFESTWEEYVNFALLNDLVLINGDIVRNEGYIKSIINDKKNGNG